MVLADPFWTYSYKFKTNKTPTKVETLLRSCFSCYVPISGAPRNFPVKNQLLPLRVGPLNMFNMECRMGGVGKVNGSLFQYSFTATKNHLDGLGSSISFSFRSDTYLYVTAKVGNAWLNNAQYKGGAIQAWTNYAKKLSAAK
ncbi:hypothetical protein [Agromyces soli]|uniref:Uncharacterized protein n=1 Tax=Agromyces soli TaxID=659012 RepID=A0ABY4AVI0_9MICO|nr:hypothetical protein [Agromyces soli]UOE27192.1 hypothetical protein MTP13_05250 [Agromyces soli]